ncbi:MAG: NDP-sugar pyrophosphorylase family protein [Paraglaciecola sp.]
MGSVPIVLHVAAALVLGGARRIIVLSGANHVALCAGLGLSTEGLSAQGDFYFQSIDGCNYSVPFELRFSGHAAGTAGRLLALTAEELGDASLLSYTDVLSDASLNLLISACKSDIDLAMLAVRPTLPWGVIELDANDGITGFTEKPRVQSRWINGGVMAISADIQSYIFSASDMLEEAVIPRLLSNGKLRAVRHDGVWFPMDSPKDYLGVNHDVSAGVSVWRRWKGLYLSSASEMKHHA